MFAHVSLGLASFAGPGNYYQESSGEANLSRKPTSAASGKEMFDAYCASCHGVDGKGNGPAAPALKMQPADLTLLAQKNGGKFPAMHVMSSIRDVTQNVHGSKDMPVWGPVLSSVSSNNPAIVTQRISNLTKYIESLQVK